jgi:hypothetical protein
VIRATYQDRDNGRGQRFTAHAEARVGSLPLHLANPPHLAAPELTAGGVRLSWTPGGSTDGLHGYTVQAASHFVQPLFDDAEGSLSENWTPGQFLAEWSQDVQYAHSPLRSFWSGRGDVLFDVDTSLTLRHDLLLPAGLPEAHLSFYSRYYNGLSDNGYVEISTDGGATWSTRLRLYANPQPAPPAGHHLRHHQVDLSDYVGVPFRIRFRYNNGIVSFAPESPGWWIDDVTVAGGAWQTAGRTGPVETALTAPAAATVPVFYRVQATYHDGSGSAWSNVQVWP